MERYYTEKRKKAEALERYISGLEEENRQLRELLTEVISGHEHAWEWKHPSMDWVEVQVSKRALVDIDKVLKGGGE